MLSQQLLMNIDQILTNIHPLNEASKNSIKQCISQVEFAKGKLLFKANKIESSIYFLKKGIVRAYADQKDKQITFWFGEEGDPVLSMKSYVENKAGYENVEALEDCELFRSKKLI